MPNQKPTPPQVSGAIPVLGHALEFRKSRETIFERGYAEHGAVFSYKLANQNVAVFGGTQSQRIFFSETDHALNMQEPYRFLQAMFEGALFLAPHDQYLKQRPMVMELFKRQKMLDYLQIMQVEVQKMLDRWGDEGEIEFTDEMNLLVQEVAGYCFLGAEVHEQVGREFWDLYGVLSAALDPILPPDLPLPKFWKRDRAKAKMTAILKPMIAARREAPDQFDDLLQHLVVYTMENMDEISDETIVNLLLALMFAGHETTAGQGAWAVIQLLQNPGYLALVQAEIEEHTTAGEHFDHRAMAKLTHTAWAVRETERMQPSADILMRTVHEDVDLGDFIVPKGWLAQVSADIAHNLPEVWSNPAQYDPLRYSPDRAEDKQDRYSMIGFGGGMHKCTGMNFANNEMIIVVTLLFQQFDVELVTKNPGVERGLGANRPHKTILRYKRKA